MAKNVSAESSNLSITKRRYTIYMKNKTFRTVLLKYKSYLVKLLQYKIVQQSVLRMKDNVAQSTGCGTTVNALLCLLPNARFGITYFFSD